MFIQLHSIHSIDVFLVKFLKNEIKDYFWPVSHATTKTNDICMVVYEFKSTNKGFMDLILSRGNK